MKWTSIFVLLTTCAITKAAHHMIAELQEIPSENKTLGIFKCTVHEGQNYFLNHMMSWSKIGRDGKEHFLSLNWQLVQGAKFPQYSISSATYGSAENQMFFFVLAKDNLTTEDHGEYICRLFDFDRSLMLSESVQVVIYDDGLALSPYRIDAKSGTDVAINCMTKKNETFFAENTVYISHVNSDGKETTISENDRLVNTKAPSRYDITNTTVDGNVNFVLTIKGLTEADNGHFVCGIKNNTGATVTETNSSVTVNAVQLEINPMFLLQIPTDTQSSFACSCQKGSEDVCKNSTMVWKMVDKNGTVTEISRDNTVTANKTLFSINNTGIVANLSVSSIVEDINEGRYVCSLQDSKNNTVAETSIPVSVNPVNLGALAVTESYPSSFRVVCAVSGTAWNNRYMKLHRLVWVYNNNVTETTLSVNGNLDSKVDTKKYKLLFDPSSHFSILDVNGVTKADHGDYICRLENIHSGSLIREEKLAVTGKVNTNYFSGIYDTTTG